MRKLTVPEILQEELFALCTDEVTDAQEKAKYIVHIADFRTAAMAYAERSLSRDWYLLPRAAWGKPSQVITGTITKDELVTLYSKYMVDSKGASRKAYDDLKVAAGGKCPFCGGIGHVHYLDHYLPKSVFPLHSINPHNLVPSCGDCNTGKNNTFSSTLDGQGLHPYMDAPHFFNERWVYASVQPITPVTIQFSAIPPPHWSLTDQSRAKNHFADNELPRRYSVECTDELTTIIGSRRTTLKRMTDQEFSDHLLETAANSDLLLNGWRRTLYLGLGNSAWFCNQSF